MKKYFTGFLFGALLVFSTQVFADSESKVAKEVQGEIIVIFDGTELETTGIIIDGVSYLPLRAVGTVMGLHVDYVGGKAILRTPVKEAADLSELKEQVKEEVKEEIQRDQEIKALQDELMKREKNLDSQKAALAEIEKSIANEVMEIVAESLKLSRDQFVKAIEENEARIAEIKQQLAELEAE